jgi:rod shape determining protein RodA
VQQTLRPMPAQKPFSALNWEGDLVAFARRTDWLTPLIIIVLTVWSLAAIYSTNSLKTASFFAQEFAPKQLVFIALGWAAYWVVSLAEPKLLERFAWLLYALGILTLLPLALCACLNIDLAPLITARFGARRWIALPGFSVQPAEFVKITTLILLAHTAGRGPLPYPHLSKPERLAADLLLFCCRLRPFRRVAAPLVKWLPLLIRVAWLTALPFILIFLQPDLGSALTYIPMLFALLLVAGIPLRFFAFVALAALPFSAAVAADLWQYGDALRQHQTAREQAGAALSKDPSEEVNKTFKGILPVRNYQRSRLMTMIAPELIDPHGVGKSWQPRQARMAVARGGFSGEGYQKGTLVRLGWLPEAAAHNDFLFSCIAEESGFVGLCSVIGLFALLIGRTLRNAAKAAAKFGVCIAAGVAAVTAGHVFQNIGMNMGIMPVTGVSLPFLSYGGSFILSCFLLFGLVQSVHRSSLPLVAEEPTNPESQSRQPSAGHPRNHPNLNRRLL